MCLVTQLCPTLCDPMDCCLPGSSAGGLFQARILEWGAISTLEDLSSQGSNSHLLHLLQWKVDSLPPASPGKVKVTQSSPTLCNPMDYTVHRISRPEYRSG